MTGLKRAEYAVKRKLRVWGMFKRSCNDEYHANDR